MEAFSRTEAIALFVAILLALGFVSLLASLKMAEHGLPPKQRRNLLAAIWLFVISWTGILLVLRQLSGPIIGGVPAAGNLWIAALSSRQWLVIITAGILLISFYWGLRRSLKPLANLPPAWQNEELPENEPSCSSLQNSQNEDKASC